MRMNPSGIAQNVESYGEYIARIRVPILDIYEVPSRNSRYKLTHTYIREEHKANFRYLVDYVCGLHKEAKSLELIAEPSLIFEDGNLRIRGVEIAKMLLLEDEYSDFELIGCLMENLLRDHNPQNYESRSFDDLIRKLKQSNRIFVEHTRSKCGKKDVDLTIMALFETELLSFQWLTFEYGISKYFIPGSNNISSNSSSAGYAGQDSVRSFAGQRRQASTPIPSYGTSLRRPSWS